MCTGKQDRNTVEEIHYLQFMQHIMPRLYEFKTFCSDLKAFKALISVRVN